MSLRWYEGRREGIGCGVCALRQNRQASRAAGIPTRGQQSHWALVTLSPAHFSGRSAQPLTQILETQGTAPQGLLCHH